MSQRKNQPSGTNRRAACLFAIALVPLTVLTVIDGPLADVHRTTMLPLSVQALLLATGLALALAGLADGRPERLGAPAYGRIELAGLALVTAAAFAVRLWRLDTLRILVDEGNSIDSLFHARRAGAALLLPPSQYVTTLVYPYWNSLLVAAAGPSLSGLRLASATLGALSVPALWLLARVSFGQVTAMCAAILLTALPVHLHFSRIALPHVMDALSGTLAMACAGWALTGAGRSLWVAAGVALGLTHYGFEAGRWFYTPLMVVWIAVHAAVTPRDLRPRRDDLVMMVLGFVVTVMPLYGALLGAGIDIAPRLRSASVDPADIPSHVQELARRLWFALGVYLWIPEQAQFYGGDQALIPPAIAPFALIGTVLAMAQRRRIGLLVPLWLAAVWLANAAIRDSAVYARWVVATPAIALAAAAGVHAMTVWFGRHSQLVAVTLSVALAALQIDYYFYTHVDRLTVQALAAKPYRDASDAALRAATVLRHGMIIVISDPVIDVHPPRSLLRLLRDDDEPIPLEAISPGEVDAAKLTALAADRDVAFFLDPSDERTVERLAACFQLDGPRFTPDARVGNKALTLYLARAGLRSPTCNVVDAL